MRRLLFFTAICLVTLNSFGQAVATSTIGGGSGRVTVAGFQVFDPQASNPSTLAGNYWDVTNNVNFFINMINYTANASSGKIAVVVADPTHASATKFKTQIEARGNWTVDLYSSTNNAAINTASALTSNNYKLVILGCGGDGGSASYLDDATFNGSTGIRSFVSTSGRGLLVTGWWIYKSNSATNFKNMLQAIGPYSAFGSESYQSTYNLLFPNASHTMLSASSGSAISYVSVDRDHSWVTWPTGYTINSAITANSFEIVANATTYSDIHINEPISQFSGTTISLSAVGGTAYSWSGPNGFTSTSASPTISNSTVLATGTYNCTITRSTAPTTVIATTKVTITQAPTPVLSTSVSGLYSIKACSGAASTNSQAQSFTITGSNLTANVTLTAPTGFTIGTTAAGATNTSLVLTQSSGTVSATIFVKQASISSGPPPSGNISIASTGVNTLSLGLNGGFIYSQPFGNALSFDGVDDKVSVNSANAFNFTDASSYSLEAMIYPRGFTDKAGIISKSHTNGSSGYVLRLTSSGNFRGLYFDGMETADNILELNKWYHIAAVKDGNIRHIYVNGVDMPLTGTPITVTSNSDPLVLGKDYNADATGRFFNGDLDEVRIWSIARSLVDIQATRWATLTSTEAGLEVYFLMGQGTPNGNNSSQVALSSNIGGMISGSFSGFALNGNTSNFVSSTNFPQISGGSSFNICKSSSNQLTHDISGGTWSMNATSGISLSSSGLLVATSAAMGSTQVNYAYTLNSCPFTSQSFVSIPSPRPFLNALHFNGSSKVVIGNKPEANLTTNMTIEAWVNVPVGTSNINTILAKSTAGNNVQGYKFGVNEWQSGAGKLLLEAAGGTAISSTPITFGAWQHVAVVVNGNLATFYINGQVAGSGAVALQANTSASLTMGAFSDGSYLFNGTMDEVRLWNTSKSQADIQSKMYSVLSGTETGLLAYYDFNQGMPYSTNTSITSLIDKSTSVWPGTFASFPLTGQTGNFVMNSNGPAIYGASTVCIGSTSQLGHPSSGGTWTIDGSGVTISSTGLVTIPNSITAGTRTVSYSYAYQGCTLVDTKVITIAANPVLSGTSTWSIPATSQLTATTAVSLSSPWISATPSVATVSNTGLVTGVSAGTTTITYTDVNGCVANTNVTINVSPPELSGLTVVGASFSPSFNASTITYTSSVANNVPNINITPYTTVSGAVITVNGITTSSGSLRSVTLSVGSNVIPIVVTSGNLSKTYTLTISRAVGPPTITSFSPAQVNAGGTVTITGTNFLGATAVSFGGVAASAYTVTSNTQIIATVGAGASGMVAVTNSGTTFNLVGFGVNSTNANLSALALSVGSLSPLFNASALNYTATVTAPSITITPRVAQSNATITINGTAVANNSASSSIPLNLGSNPISVVVTAQDGISTKTYTVDVTRLAASSDASLSSLMTSTGTLSPAFVSGTLNYSVSVPNNTNTLSLVPTVNEVNASLKVNNVTLASGSTSAFIPLTVGDNVITVVVTAQDGATLQTYTITVTRAPLVITYASSSITGTVDTAIASLAAPSVSGTVTSFAISPALPAGINLNSVTGEITGATAFAGTSQHIITATNSAGTATATINITIAKAGRTILGLANALAKTTSDPAFVLGASPSKGTGSITYTSSNPAVVTISGSTVTIKGVGTAVISATILADANYEGAAAQSTITVIVGDSDGDGVPDSIEVAQGTNPFDASSVKDTDGDGVPDYVEVQQGTNPNNSKDAIDTDGDGVPDYIEKAQGTNPLVAGDKIKDTDGDGVPDYIEVAQGTNPAVAFDARDSDGDGIPDFVEIAAGQDPNDATSAIDSDGDGVPDYIEVKQGTNPGLAGDAKDSDGDGVPDYVELYQGTNPNSKTSFSDVDGDGFSDYLEGFNRIKGAVIPDLDGDGIPDYRDTDCDGDGIPDALENDINYGSMDDCDHDGIPNRLDKDQCGTYTTQGVSPDGDGVNDNLVIPGILSTQPNKLTVYNRTGIIVFEQSNYKNDWGGTDQAGNLLPDGVYYYVVDFNGAKPAVSTFIYISRLAQ
jgi:gliding motility-associated-like protein